MGIHGYTRVYTWVYTGIHGYTGYERLCMAMHCYAGYTRLYMTFLKDRQFLCRLFSAVCNSASCAKLSGHRISNVGTITT